MNFCKMYNKIMNYFNEMDVSMIDETPRENRKEINIILGIIYIIISMIGTFIVAILLTITYVSTFIVSNTIIILCKIISWSNKYLISKCDINKEE